MSLRKVKIIKFELAYDTNIAAGYDELLVNGLDASDWDEVTDAEYNILKKWVNSRASEAYYLVEAINKHPKIILKELIKEQKEKEQAVAERRKLREEKLKKREDKKKKVKEKEERQLLAQLKEKYKEI